MMFYKSLEVNIAPMKLEHVNLRKFLKNLPSNYFDYLFYAHPFQNFSAFIQNLKKKFLLKNYQEFFFN
jgi:hypothetical protein